MSTCMPAHHVCSVPIKAKRGHLIPWHWSDSCALLCGCWELNQGPLQEQSRLSNTKPSLQLYLIKARESLPRRLEHDFCFSRAWTDFYKVVSVYINIISPGKHLMVPSKPGHSKSFDPTNLFLGKCLRKMP